MVKPKLIIVGGGISGLTAAWYAQKKWDVTLLEKSDRLGGHIRTINHDGFLFELGPRSCRTRGTGRATLQLIRELGIEEQVILPAPAAQKRYLYTQKQLKLIPHNFSSFLTSPWFWKVIPAVVHELFQGRSIYEKTVEDYISMRFSPWVAETLFDPLVSGIYAGDPKQLSFPACFPDLFKVEQQFGSLTWGLLRKPKRTPSSDPWIAQMEKSPLFTFSNGMETLTDALQQKLKVNIHLNTPVLKDHNLEVITPNKTFSADAILYTTPSSTVPRASITLTSIGYDKSVLPNEGFGYLIPRKENLPLLGVVFDSSAFPQHNCSLNETRLTCMHRGTEALDLLPYLKEHLNITTPPKTVLTTPFPEAIPQYTLGHLPPPPNHIGNSYTGISVNDCIAAAENFILSSSQK